MVIWAAITGLKRYINSVPTDDSHAIHDNIAEEIQPIDEKTTLVGADVVIIEDSEDDWKKKSVQVENIDDDHAIHDNIDEEIHPITEKEKPVDADELLIEDFADDWAKKRIPLSQTKRRVLYGETIDGGVSVGDLIYNDDTEWLQAEADDSDTMNGLLGIYLGDNDVLLWGLYTTTGLTQNATYYGSATAGAITTTKPDEREDIARVIGQAISTTVLFFKPDGSWETIEKIILNAPDILEHETGGCYYNSLVRIDGSHVMLAYMNSQTDGDCIIKVFEVDVNYSLTELSSLNHDTLTGTSAGNGNSLVKIDNTHYMLAYTGTDDDGFIKVFSINSSYNITQVSSLEHDATGNGAVNHSLVQIDVTHYMLSYTDDARTADHFMETFLYNSTTFAVKSIDQLMHETLALAGIHSLVKIDSNHFLLSYTGYFSTFSIDGAFTVSHIAKSAYLSRNLNSSLVKIDLTNFVCAQKGYGISSITTIYIDASYNIFVTDLLQYGLGQSDNNSLIKVNSTVFVVARRDDSDNAGYISVFSLDHKNYITEEYSDQYVSGSNWSNSLILLDSLHAILAYTGTDNDGFIEVFEILL